MSGGPDKVKETAQEKALAEFAANKWTDYKQRWLPVQRQLAAQVQEMGKPDSAARRLAAGKANADTQMAFGQTQGAVEKQMSNVGAAPGSGRFNLGSAGVSEDAATSGGLGMTIADQQVTDAYLSGLSSLAAVGQGRSATVGDALSQQAQTSARQSSLDAQISADRRGAQGQLAGQFAGYGLYASMQPGGGPQAPYAGGSRTPLGTQADQFATNPQAGF
jgi:hypothetical protein